VGIDGDGMKREWVMVNSVYMGRGILYTVFFGGWVGERKQGNEAS